MMSAELRKSMDALWTRYAGTEPTSTEADIGEDTVTISSGGVVASFDRRMAAETSNGVSGIGIGIGDPPLTVKAYELEARATVARLTHREVLSITTHFDRESDIATDVVKLGGAARRARLRKPASAGSRY
jgi:hypothetical protein